MDFHIGELFFFLHRAKLVELFYFIFKEMVDQRNLCHDFKMSTHKSKIEAFHISA